MLAPILIEIYNELYKESMVDPNVPENKKLFDFQRRLKATQHWNTLQIESRVRKIEAAIPDLMEVLEAIFLVNAQIWGSIRYEGEDDEDTLQLKLPTKEAFCHNLIIEGAEQIFNDPYLYDKRKQTTSNHHSRRMYLIKLLCDCSSTVLDKAFPREDILRRFMQSEREKRTKKQKSHDSDSDTDTETAKKNKIIVDTDSDDSSDDDDEVQLTSLPTEDEDISEPVGNYSIQDDSDSDDDDGPPEMKTVSHFGAPQSNNPQFITSSNPLPPPPPPAPPAQFALNNGMVSPPVTQQVAAPVAIPGLEPAPQQASQPAVGGTNNFAL